MTKKRGVNRSICSRLRSWAGLALIGVLIGTTSSLAREFTSCTVIGSHQRGSELKMLVETAQHVSPYFAHGTRTFNLKRYLVTVDLSRTDRRGKHARVIGPVSVQCELDWSERLGARPEGGLEISFNPDGNLMRVASGSPDSPARREILVTTCCNPEWKIAEAGNFSRAIPDSAMLRPPFDVTKLFRLRNGSLEPVSCVPVP